jgi:MBG domain (YGX type)
LNVSVTVVYGNNTNAGTATADASYAGDANHYGSTATQVTFTIDKASSTTTVTCAAGPFTYTGSAIEPCTYTVTGVAGLNQGPTAVPSANYSNNTDAGTASGSYNYAGDANHEASSDLKNFTIDKASSSTSITCPTSVTYSGSALEPCSATATGAGGLNASVTVLYGSNTNVGTATADATYGGDANHEGSTATQVTFTITKASSSTTINCPASVTYNGSPQTPCSATATGAGGLNVSVNVTYGNNTNAGTATADATYGGDTNHDGSTSTQVTFTINKANQTITWSNPAAITYGTALSGTQLNATVAGVPGGTPAGALSYTPAAGVVLNAGMGQLLAVDAAATANYYAAHKTVNIDVNKAPLTVTADNKSMMFGGSVPAFTVTYGGFVNGDGPGSLTGSLAFTVKTLPLPGSTVTVTISTPTGTYAIIPGGLTSSNYNITFVNGTLTIATWTITGFYQPVDMNTTSMFVWNTVKGGSTVPLKFNIYAGPAGPLTEKKNVSDVMGGSVQIATVGCDITVGIDTLVDYVTDTGNTTLRYDTLGAQFIQNWQTPKGAGKCYQVRMTALDGSHLDAFFKTK